MGSRAQGRGEGDFRTRGLSPVVCAGAFGVTGVLGVTWGAFRVLRQVWAVGAESFGKERGCWGVSGPGGQSALRVAGL